MTRKQIERFVRKVTSGNDIPIRYVNNCNEGYKGRSHEFDSVDAVAVIDKITGLEIFIRKKSLKELSNIVIKGMMLHEVGHFVMIPDLVKEKLEQSIVANELYAQMWAIMRAEQLNMPNIRKHCIQVFDKWKKVPWNSPLRRYRLAANVFEKNRKSLGY